MAETRHDFLKRAAGRKKMGKIIDRTINDTTTGQSWTLKDIEEILHGTSDETGEDLMRRLSGENWYIFHHIASILLEEVKRLDEEKDNN